MGNSQKKSRTYFSMSKCAIMYDKKEDERERASFLMLFFDSKIRASIAGALLIWENDFTRRK